MLEPGLQRLREELERLGMVVVPHGDHICVRLPLLTSVHVRVEGGVLRCEPRIGPLPRASTLAGTAAATAGSVATVAIAGLPALPLILATGGLAALGVQLGGFVLAESCITRVQLLWARLYQPPGERALSPSAAAELPEAPAPGIEVLPRARARES